VRFDCPVLVLGGARDAVFHADEQREFARAIAGSKLLLYRHCGHAPNWEQPQRVAEDVQAFAAS
jgi:pimeloyl-ACP methyl ester carboxylesterase